MYLQLCNNAYDDSTHFEKDKNLDISRTKHFFFEKN